MIALSQSLWLDLGALEPLSPFGRIRKYPSRNHKIAGETQLKYSHQQHHFHLTMTQPTSLGRWQVRQDTREMIEPVSSKMLLALGYSNLREHVLMDQRRESEERCTNSVWLDETFGTTRPTKRCRLFQIIPLSMT